MACNADIKKDKEQKEKEVCVSYVVAIKTGNDSDNIYVIIQKARFNRKKSRCFSWLEKNERDKFIVIMSIFFSDS